MAYSDIQNKVGQTQMANQILIAQAMSDEEKFKKKKELKKEVRKTPKQRQSEARGKDPKFQGGSPGIEFKPEEFVPDPTADEIQEALREDDYRRGDYLEDPENPLSDLMKIGGAAAGFGGNLLRMLINPLGGNALAMDLTQPDPSIMNYVTEQGFFLDGQGRAYMQGGGKFQDAGEYDVDIHGLPVPLAQQMQINQDVANITPKDFSPPPFRYIPHIRIPEIRKQEMDHMKNFIEAMGGDTKGLAKRNKSMKIYG